MTGTPPETHWLTLYRKAIVEEDPKQLRVPVAQAQHAIRDRARELWYARTPNTTERLRIDAASQCLGVLCTIGADK